MLMAAVGSSVMAMRREGRRIAGALVDPEAELELREVKAGIRDAPALDGILGELRSLGFTTARDFATPRGLVRVLVEEPASCTIAVVEQEDGHDATLEFVSELADARVVVTSSDVQWCDPTLPEDMAVVPGYAHDSPERLLARHRDRLDITRRAHPAAHGVRVGNETAVAELHARVLARRVEHRRSHGGATPEQLRARELPIECILEMRQEQRRRGHGEAAPALAAAAAALLAPGPVDARTLDRLTRSLEATGSTDAVRRALAPLRVSLDDLVTVALPANAALHPYSDPLACETCDLASTAMPMLEKPGPVIGRLLFSPDEEVRDWAADQLVSLGAGAAGASELILAWAEAHERFGWIYGYREPIVSLPVGGLLRVLTACAAGDPADSDVLGRALDSDVDARRWLAAIAASPDHVPRLEALLDSDAPHWVRRDAARRLAVLLEGKPRLLAVALRAWEAAQASTASQGQREPETDRAIATELLAQAVLLDPRRVLHELVAIAGSTTDNEAWLRYEEGFEPAWCLAIDALADAVERDGQDPILANALARADVEVRKEIRHEVDRRRDRCRERRALHGR